jgi:thiol-disulfide isomerase/thioredoxin
MDVRTGLIIVIFLLVSCTRATGQTIQRIDGDGIAVLSSLSNDTTYILNFWATWCSPCIEEIAIFEKYYRNEMNPKVKVILVSLDFISQVESRVIPFLEKKGISAEVRIMTDTDYNAWIDRVDPSWSGAIPATLIYNRDRRVFFEKELSYNELVKQIHQIQH